MDEDELLYREMNEEDPWYMGDEPDEDYEADDDDEETYSRRNAFMLFWNPADSNYTLADYARDREHFGKRFSMDWTITWPDEVQEGDKYYMVRLGEGRTGIIWRGTFSGLPYKDKDWKDKRRKRWYVPICVEDAVKPNARPLVTLDEMKSESPDADWENMLCGQQITPELADRFDELTRMNQYKESHPYKGHTSKEAYEENKRSLQRKQDQAGCFIFCMIILSAAIAMIWLLT